MFSEEKVLRETYLIPAFRINKFTVRLGDDARVTFGEIFMDDDQSQVRHRVAVSMSIQNLKELAGVINGVVAEHERINGVEDQSPRNVHGDG